MENTPLETLGLQESKPVMKAYSIRSTDLVAAVALVSAALDKAGAEYRSIEVWPNLIYDPPQQLQSVDGVLTFVGDPSGADPYATLRIVGMPPAIEGVSIAPAKAGEAHYNPEDDVEPVTVDNIKQETLRRLLIAFGARDQEHLAIKVQDAVMAAGALTDKQARDIKLTDKEQAEAAYLRGAQALYTAIKAAGNKLEAMTPVPADYATGPYWP
jgi:hypothetical protein